MRLTYLRFCICFLSGVLVLSFACHQRMPKQTNERTNAMPMYSCKIIRMCDTDGLGRPPKRICLCSLILCISFAESHQIFVLEFSSLMVMIWWRLRLFFSVGVPCVFWLYLLYVIRMSIIRWIDVSKSHWFVNLR